MKSVVNENSEVYYSEMYWNDIPQVLRYMNKNFTKSEQTTWQSDFKKRFAKKPFEHALVLNCGNGWVEREFIDKKIITKATAFDYSTDLLAQATKNPVIIKKLFFIFLIINYFEKVFFEGFV